MESIVRFSVSRPRMVTVLFCAIAMGLGSRAGQIRLQLDGRSLIPDDEAALQASDRAAKVFQLHDTVLLGVAPRDGRIYSSAELFAVADLARRLSNTPGLRAGSVHSMVNAPGLLFAGAGLGVHDLRNGRGISAEQAALMQAALTRVGWNDGVLLAKDGRTAVIYAEVEDKADRFDLGRRLEELARGAQQSGRNHVFLTGTALAQAALGQAAAADLARLIPTVLGLLLVVLWICFRSPWPALLSLTEIGLSLLATVGVMGLLHKSIFVTTLVLPVVLVTVGVADDVYSLRHYFEVRGHRPELGVREAVTTAFREVGAHIWLTAILTAVGLLTFAITSLEPLRIFGLFGALALTISTLATFTLVPALLVLKEGRRQRPAERREAQPGELGRRLTRLYEAAGPGRILVGALVMLGAVAALAARVTVDDSWVRNLPANSLVSQGDREMNERLGGSLPLELEVTLTGKVDFLDPAAFAKLAEIESELRNAPQVGAVESFYGSALRAEATFSRDSYASIRANFQGLTAEQQRQTIQHGYTALKALPEAEISRWLTGDRRTTRVMALLRDAHYQNIKSLIERVDRRQWADASVVPFGEGGVSYQAVQLLVDGQKSSIACAFLTDFALLWILLRSWRAGLLALLPVAFSLLSVLAMLALTNTALGIANSLFMAVALGIGTDFSVHLTAACKERLRAGEDLAQAVASALEHVAPSIATSALALTLGFAVLCLSRVRPNAQLGWMICLSLAVCAVATLVLGPNLLLTLAALRKQRSRKPQSLHAGG